MKSISIYTITRNQNIEQLQKLERQLSGRDYFLKMREWELESMKALTAELETCMEDVYALRFFYSFQIPRLGKEFDLLQIKEDQLNKTRKLKGVYNINRGYAVFRQVQILCESDEYYIVQSGDDYGLSNNDHIALTGKDVHEGDVIS